MLDRADAGDGMLQEVAALGRGPVGALARPASGQRHPGLQEDAHRLHDLGRGAEWDAVREGMPGMPP
eukprot:8582448-Alexandrium_andersonii.AAC.1